MPVEARFQGYPIHANNGIPYAVGVRCCVDFVDDGYACVCVCSSVCARRLAHSKCTSFGLDVMLLTSPVCCPSAVVRLVVVCRRYVCKRAFASLTKLYSHVLECVFRIFSCHMTDGICSSRAPRRKKCSVLLRDWKNCSLFIYTKNDAKSLRNIQR